MRARSVPIALALLLLALTVVAASSAFAADTVLVPANSVWRYLDNGSDQGTAWRTPSFNDSAWAAGQAELGYGDGDEATTVGYGPDASNKYIATYFRHAFSVADPSVYQSLTLNVRRDDGAVVYLNGTEVFRTNMPSGSITYSTPASVAVGGSDETAYVVGTLSPSFLVAGTNVLAVEIHQANAASSDISFALELLASDATMVTRGPYLQIGTPTSVVVRWRTNAATDGRVRYGTDAGNLMAWADSSAFGTTHEVKVSGLAPDTRYYYSVGTTAVPVAGGDASYFFVTAPAPGTPKPTRVWVLGDSGTANANAAAVRDAYLAYTGSRGTDLWLMLGDNAYPDGTDARYQAAVFNMYPGVLRNTVLWPTLGNHDGQLADSVTQTGPYYDIFTLPTQGEAGGIPSGTEAYYSFDYGNIHFIVLESFETDRSATGPMLTWLQQDLAATTQPWVIAFWHHSPYSKGSHDSDVDIEMVQMRENALPILEAGGVDLVLTGHSHSYERSFLIDGHYGLSSSFTAAMKKDGGDGRTDGTGAYGKPTLGPASHEGAVYAVAGSSGQTGGGALNHSAMFVSFNTLGSMVLDVSGNRLDAAFIDSAGMRRDYFTLAKGTAGSLPLAPTAVFATAGNASVTVYFTPGALGSGALINYTADCGGVTNTGGGSPITVSGLINGTPYTCRVKTTSTVGDSPWSANSNSVTPSAPSNSLSIIEHYYQSILGRTGDAGGVAFWQSEVTRLSGLGTDPTEAYIAMAVAFYSSAEFAARGLSDTAFVDSLYSAFFNRTADAAGLDYWVGQINQGLSREMVMYAFLFSSEFASFMAPNVGSIPSRAELYAVIDFYRGAFGRLPDSTGFKYWVNQFRSAQCSGNATGAVYDAVIAIAGAFFDSSEYWSSFPAKTNYSQINNFYNAFMRRGADVAGYLYWVNQLAGGANFDTVRKTGFIDSPEFGNRLQQIANAGCTTLML